MERYIERAQSQGSMTGDEMAHLGYLCLHGVEDRGRKHPPSPLIPAAKAAWRAALQLMRSQTEPPCMKAFAMVMHPTSHHRAATNTIAWACSTCYC